MATVSLAQSTQPTILKPPTVIASQVSTPTNSVFAPENVAPMKFTTATIISVSASRVLEESMVLALSAQLALNLLLMAPAAQTAVLMRNSSAENVSAKWDMLTTAAVSALLATNCPTASSSTVSAQSALKT